MRALTYRWLRRGWTSAVIVLLLATGLSAGPLPAQAAPPASGMLCSTSSSPNASFTLSAQTGTISMPDGNTIFSWGYGLGGSAFQLPGPVLCVNQGDTVTLVLHNSLPEATSIMFLGIDDVQANGAPAQPEGSGAGLTSLTTSAPAGGSVTYSFIASNPGTYLYESGTDVGKQVQMGLYGALVVRPTSHPNWAYANGSQAFGEFDPNAEFVMLLSEVDPNLHSAVELGQPYDVSTLHPRYWLINGRAFPDTIAPNNAAWLPSQPYGALMHITVQDNALGPSDPNGPNKAPALIRYLNAGSRNHPFHPHGQNGRLLARDATPLIDGSGNDLSYETFAFTIGSGQTWDQTYHYDDQEHFNLTDNQIPVTVPQLQNLTFKDAATYYSGSPVLGQKGQLPVGTTSFNECGEYYMVMHSHALYEVANYDAGFGGMLTLERIDPLPQNASTPCAQ